MGSSQRNSRRERKEDRSSSFREKPLDEYKEGMTQTILTPSALLIDHPSCPILYKILVSVLNRPFLHKQNSKSCHYFLLVCDSKSENLSGHFFVSS